MVAAAIGAVSAAVAASPAEGESEESALAAGRRACTFATRGFRAAQVSRLPSTST